MDRCPDNSTECLLRVLIAQSNSGSPWDSRSFGFTVAIGVLAFFVSWVTVFQGLFAAGPGRLKASAAAIGQFSKLTETRISWLELAYRSTAVVPIITTERLVRRLDNQTPPKVAGKDYSLDGNDAGTAASWLRLLRCVGIEEDMAKPEEDDGYRGHYDFMRYATDFLPADVTAPPAAIQLSTIAILAAMADTSVKIEKIQDQIRVAGNISQVSFRQHPILGSLAAYERYETPRSGNEYSFFGKWPMLLYGSRGRCTRLSFELALGILKMHCFRASDNNKLCHGVGKWCSVYAFGGRSPGHSPDLITYTNHYWAFSLGLMVARTDYDFRPFPWRKMNLHASLKALWDRAPVLHEGLDEIKKALAPCDFVRNDNHFEYKAKNDPSTSLEFELRGSWANPKPSKEYFRPFEDGDVEYMINRALATLEKWTHGSSAIEVGERDPRDVLYALRWVDMHLTNRQEEAFTVYDSLAREIRALTKKDSTNTAASSGASTSADNLEASSAASEISNISPRQSRSRLASTVVIDECDPLVYDPERIARDRAFETLLIIRATLFAACLECGPDTSALFDDEFRDPIVKVL